MDTDKDKEKDQEKERATTTNAPEIHDIVYPSDFPQSMRTPEAIAAWNDWEKARKEKGKPITATARRLQLADCEAWGTSRAIAALKHSAKSNYQGLFEPNSHSNGTHAATLKTADPSRSIPDKLT